MTIVDRQILANEVFNKCLALLQSKGEAYSGKEDSLSNFKENGRKLNMSKYQVWAIYANKHIDSINNAIKYDAYSPVDATEGLSGRIIDAINYLVILEALLYEDNDDSAKQS